RRFEVLTTAPVDPGRTDRETVGVGLDAADAGAGLQPGAERRRLRPVGKIGRGLGALVAAGLAGAALDARATAVVGDRVDRVELGPPVPAQLVHPARDLEPGRA